MRKTGERAARTAANRARMLGAAKELFIERGYTATTMKAVAERAGMAVQTLYFTFSTKRAILSELLDVEIAGDAEPVATLDRPWAVEALAAPPAEQIRLQAAGAGRILARVAPLLEVVRSAASTDPEIAALWRANLSQRHTVQSRFAEALAAKGALREGTDAARAADIMLALLSSETYHLLVEERGWSGEEWRDWAADTLLRQLLPPGWDRS
ncbi:helix-turn-helix domain-containing protein [Actinocorallia sp. B10E7]|uniref:TetR/AcrR family transcriptional regulator n=1 Tax=Actinocorallia sp. B10E7 TaxID=3153558 RepID=UPI00325E26EA